MGTIFSGGAHRLEPRGGGFGDAFQRGLRPCKPKRTVALQTERKIGSVNRVGGASCGAECTMQRMRVAGIVLGPKSVGTVSPKGGAAASNE